MEKLFWGMVGLCTIAFAFLLGMYLNQSGVLNFSAAEETTTVASEEHPEDYSEEIQSLIEASQGNYATAMRVLEETSEENEQQIADNRDSSSSNGGANSNENSDTNQSSNANQNSNTGSSANQGTSSSDNIRTNGEVDPGRNDDHRFFLEDPNTTEESSIVEEESSEDVPSSNQDSEYQYDLFADHVVIKKYLGSKSDLTIPDTIEGKPVTELAASSFASSKKLVRVSIPDTVKTMGSNVFKSSALLVDVDMPEGLEKLGLGAFDSCSALARISIPDGVTEIEDKTFNACESLTQMKLPSSNCG